MLSYSSSPLYALKTWRVVTGTVQSLGKMKKGCLESMNREISYMKYDKGRLTGLVISYAETAF
jgi:hypothetical protein